MPSRLDKGLFLAKEILDLRELLSEKTKEYIRFMGGKRARVPAFEELSDDSLGPSQSKVSRARKKREAEIPVVKLSPAQTRIMEILQNNNGQADLTTINNYPGVSKKNVARLLNIMINKGLIATTYGGKFRLASAQNGIHL
jgi:predicted transcriptional regulator